jgi:predicted site-specific integrase-resolvase
MARQAGHATTRHATGWRTCEVAALFHVQPSTVSKWVRRGKLRTESLPGGGHAIPSHEVLRLYRASRP